MIGQNSRIVKHYQQFGGNFIDSQYLGNAFDGMGKPHMFPSYMKIFSAKSRFFTSKLMLGAFGVNNGKVEIEDEVYRWYLQGSEEKFCRSMELLEAANSVVGLNNVTFRIKLDVDYFRQPDVLMGEDNEYLLEIIGDGISDGAGGTVYTVRLQGDNPAQGMPTTLLEVGKEFSKVWTTVQSEYNQIYGTQQYGGRFMLEGQVSAFAQELVITDKAWRKDGMMGMEFQYETEDGTTKSATKFLPMAEAKMHDTLMRGMEAQIIYGKKQTRAAADGYWIKTGSGIREILKDSWQEYYNGALTTNRLKDFLLKIFFTRKNEGDRAVTFMTGTYGSIQFHNMLSAEARSFLTVDTNFINRISSGSGSGTPHLAYGAQFTRYNGPEGIVVDLTKNAFYDDRTYCKRSHPFYPNIPIDSFRMTVLDFGESDGQANVQMISVKDSYVNGYVAGTHTPAGPVTSGQMGSAKAGYSLHTAGTLGVILRDASRCGELILDFID